MLQMLGHAPKHCIKQKWSLIANIVHILLAMPNTVNMLYLKIYKAAVTRFLKLSGWTIYWKNCHCVQLELHVHTGSPNTKWILLNGNIVWKYASWIFLKFVLKRWDMDIYENVRQTNDPKPETKLSRWSPSVERVPVLHKEKENFLFSSL